MGWYTAQCKMLLYWFCANPSWKSHAILNNKDREEEERKKYILAFWQLSVLVLS